MLLITFKCHLFYHLKTKNFSFIFTKIKFNIMIYTKLIMTGNVKCSSTSKVKPNSNIFIKYFEDRTERIIISLQLDNIFLKGTELSDRDEKILEKLINS